MCPLADPADSFVLVLPAWETSYTLVQATVGVGTVLIWDLISFGTKCSAAT